MSMFSGRCDLADHIMGLGGWYDKNGNKVAFGQEGVGAYYSDELKDFEAFKAATDGVMYQHVKIDRIDQFNQEFIKKKCKAFDFEKVEEQIPDKRSKTGYKTKVSYVYTYYGKKYTLKEINKKGVYITVEIHFDTLLDIIKYYPYIVASSCSSEGKSVVFLSSESEVDCHYLDALQYGYEPGMKRYYDKALADHYLTVVRRYYDYDIDRRQAILPVLASKLTKYDDENYVLATDLPIDYMHDLNFVFPDNKSVSHWSSPKLLDKRRILVSKQDVESYLKDLIESGQLKISCVKEPENGFPLYIA